MAAFKAFLFGATIAAAIGPIALLIVNYSLSFGLRQGVRSAAGAACADLTYALVAFLAGHAIVPLLEERSELLRLLSAAALAGFGLWLAATAIKKRVPIGPAASADAAGARPLITTFILTLINPLTVLAFLALAPQLPLGGSFLTAAGFAICLFAGSLVVQVIFALSGAGLGRVITRPGLIRSLNVASGLGIMAFGVVGLAQAAGGSVGAMVGSVGGIGDPAGATGNRTAAIETQLMQADREYARDTAARGLDGWVAALAADAARVDLHGAIARGPEGARRQDAGLFADPAERLTWEPTDAGVFGDGRLGFTRGRYRVVRSVAAGGEGTARAGGETSGAGGETAGAGAYLTVWRKDGARWKVILDTGAPDPPVPAGASGARRGGGAGPGPDPVATFSILGYDPETGEVGGAVQSRVFSVGNGVLWAEAGAGVVATQAIVDVGYGPRALALLREKLAPAEIVKRVWDEDPDPDPVEWTKKGRQFAVMNARGEVAAFTGPEASTWAGHRLGRHCSAQGNILAGPAVVDRMVEAFQSTKGHLSFRLLAALEAGQAAGGDTRGMQSAAMLIVKKDGGVWLHNDVVLRLQVDDNKRPIRELRRLVEKAAEERREYVEWMQERAEAAKPGTPPAEPAPRENER